MIRLQAILLSAALLLPAGSAAARAAETTTARPIAITNVRIFFGTKIMSRGNVVIDGPNVWAANSDATVPKDAEIIDGAGNTIFPALIDAQTSGGASPRAAGFGVLTEIGGLLEPTPTEPEEAQAWVDAHTAEGAEFVKIASGDKAILKALIDAAHLRHKLAVVHAGSLKSAKEALDAGADGLVHIFTDQVPDQDFIDLAARKKVFVIPTLTLVESMSGAASGSSLTGDPRLAPYLTAEEKESLRRSSPKRGEVNFQNALEAVRRLSAAGVPILAGTDAPSLGAVHGASLHREMELLVNAGLTPVKALGAATWVPAKYLRIRGSGQIVQSRPADLVLVKGDPTEDITATRDILKVWQAGQEVPRPKVEVKPAAAP